jgi:hypothetical protein
MVASFMMMRSIIIKSLSLPTAAAQAERLKRSEAQRDEALHYENNANAFIGRHRCSNSQALQHQGQPDEHRVARHSSRLTHDMQHNTQTLKHLTPRVT